MNRKITLILMCLSLSGLLCLVSFADTEKPDDAQKQAETAKDADKAAVAMDEFWAEELARPEPQLPDERIDQFLEQIRIQDPAKAEQFDKLRKENPDEFRKQIRAEFITRFRQMRQQFERGGRDRDRRPEGAPPEQMGGRGQGPQSFGQPGTGQGPQPFGQPGGQPGYGTPWKDRIERMHNDFIAWLEKNYPIQAVEIKNLREKKPEEYIGKMAELMRRYGPIIEAERTNPKLAAILKEDMENQRLTDELLKQIRRARGQDKEKLVAELSPLISRRFDLIMAKMQMQYDDMRRRLEELQKEVKNREGELDKLKNNKDAAVDERVKKLLSESEKVKWD
ncbi:MAG: hypothetical protein JXB18_04505 [Sedimentisphaerales bacterium]|nr:hypothetical protein [Sedimentisphaerales bacterium]